MDKINAGKPKPIVARDMRQARVKKLKEEQNKIKILRIAKHKRRIIAKRLRLGVKDTKLIIHQHGRVASMSIANSFKRKRRKDIFKDRYVEHHCHFLSDCGFRAAEEYNNDLDIYLDENQDEWLTRKDLNLQGLQIPFKNTRDDIDNRILLNEFIYVITLCREPISFLFSAFNYYHYHLPRYLKVGPENDEYYDKYKNLLLSLIDNFTEDKSNGNFLLDSLSFILFRWPEAFFKYDFLGYWGFDIFKEKLQDNYSIYNIENCRILFIKYESLTSYGSEAVNTFLNIDDFNIPFINRGEDLCSHYNRLIKEVKFSDKFMDKIYGSDYARHFYSEEEISNFRKKWRK